MEERGANSTTRSITWVVNEDDEHDLDDNHDDGHLEAAVDPLRTNAPNCQVASVKVVWTLARGPDGLGETGVVDEAERAEELASQTKSGQIESWWPEQFKSKDKPVSFAEAPTVCVAAQLCALLVTAGTKNDQLEKSLNESQRSSWNR